MTKRNPDAQACRRCGKPKRPGRGQLCVDCHGTCAKCGEAASLRTDGQFRTHCEPCRREVDTRANCTRCGAIRTGSHPSYCRSCYQAYSRDWSKKNPDKVREKNRRQDLKRTYGLTPQMWDDMLAEQNGGCAICGTTEAGGRGRFHVDHDHHTGKIRALLCTNCNVALGLVSDSPQLLRALAGYVEYHRIT